jgi:hypothetical protein
MDIKFLIIFIGGLILYLVGFLLGLRFNKNKHKEELLAHNQMWGEVACYILENHSTFDENGVFDCKHSRGNIHIEKASKERTADK